MENPHCMLYDWKSLREFHQLGVEGQLWQAEIIRGEVYPQGNHVPVCVPSQLCT